jgi:fibronectin type 3 domain-containing protein
MRNRKQIKKLSVILYFMITCSAVQLAVAQDITTNDEIVRWSEDGMVIFTSEAIISPSNPFDSRVKSVIYRSINNANNFEEIARIHAPESLNEFKARTNQRVINSFMEFASVDSEDELWEFIQENQLLENYGYSSLDQEIWSLFGTAYVDESITEVENGTEVHYRVLYELEDGSISNFGYQGSGTVGRMPNILKPTVFDRTESDSLVGGKWASPIAGSEDAFFANIYKRESMDQEFVKLDDRVLATRTSDSLMVYQWEETAEPERLYQYLIEPIDIVGNKGPLSDTLTVISVSFNNLPRVGNVSAVDTTSGIYLSWDPVPNKSYITGVEIRRSRESNNNYIVLDTLSVRDSEYIDTRIVPNIPYFYEFRVVTVRNTAPRLPSGVARASFRNNTLPPSPPNNLRAEQEEDGIRLRWDANPEPDMFGYYVYRGTSRYDSMAVISKAIRDTTTFFDDSEELNGRTNYVYAVKSINVSELQSELSESVIIRPARTVRPPAPVGISGYAERNRIRLTWQDVRERDSAVEGYYVYRGREPITGRAEAESGLETAEENGFERLNEEMISANAFDDPSVTSGETYYYAVTSVDLYGEESLLSNTSAFTTAAGSLLPPSQVSARNISDGVEIRWNATMQNGASGYRVYRRTRGDQRAEPLATLETGTTRYVDQNVQSGDFYWYSVSILGESAESDRSEERSVRIDANP